MRLFVAVNPPEPAVAELASAVHDLRALPGAERLRWAERPGWHFTLAFLGEVDEALLPSSPSAWAAPRTGIRRTRCGSRAAAGSGTGCCGWVPRARWRPCAGSPVP